MNLEAYREQDGQMVWLNEDETQRFLDLVDGRKRLAFRIGVRSGLRTDEIVRVASEDVEIPTSTAEQERSDQRLHHDDAGQSIAAHRSSFHIRATARHVLLEIAWFTGARMGAIRGLTSRTSTSMRPRSTTGTDPPPRPRLRTKAGPSGLSRCPTRRRRSSASTASIVVTTSRTRTAASRYFVAAKPVHQSRRSGPGAIL